jgi:hypothetical protein
LCCWQWYAIGRVVGHCYQKCYQTLIEVGRDHA